MFRVIRRSLVSLLILLAASACRREAAWALVSNEDSGDVSVIDTGRDEVVRTIKVGKRPRAIRISPDGRTAFVALSGSAKSPPGAKIEALAPEPRDDAADGIGVIDIARGVLVRTIASGRDPESFDITPDGKTLYVSNEESAQVSVLDVRTGRLITTIAVGDEPEGVTIDPAGQFVYVTSEGGNEVDVIAIATQAVVDRVATSGRPRAVAFTPTGERAFVTAENGGTVDVIDAKSHALVEKVKSGHAGARPMGIAMAPDGKHAYVGNGRQGTVSYIEVATRNVLRTVDDVGARPWGIGVSPDDRKLYVAAGPDVAVLDALTGAVLKRVAVGKGPWGVAVAPGAR